MTDSNDDFWKPFGETKWRDFATTVSATELQLRYAVSKFNGSTNSAAAKVAGYKGDKDEIRRAGYTANRSTAVVALIELAETHAPQAAGLTDAEVDAKVAKLVRSPDPQISLKATEFFDRRKQRKEAASAQPELTLEELLADIITSVPESGCGAFFAMSTFRSKTGNLINYPYLAETAPIIARYFPSEWQIWRASEKAHWVHDFLDRMAAGPFLEPAALAIAVQNKAPAPTKPTAEVIDNG
jgi:hypothetical protein